MIDDKLYIGIDIGATKTNIGIMDRGGNILKSKVISSRGFYKETSDNVLYIARTTRDIVLDSNLNGQIDSIGIGVPGTVDRYQGKVLFAPNIGWENVHIRKLFNQYFDLPIYLGQDTEAAALGEYLFGAGKGLKDVVCITIGTGIGSGIIIDGKIYKGQFGTAGEIGHIIVEKNGLKCKCGKRGCLETYSSGTGILRYFKKMISQGVQSELIENIDIEDIKTEDIFRASKKGDKLSREAINNAIDYLSIGIINLINIICPQKVILSGGISREKELFIVPLIEKVSKDIYNLLVDKVKVEVAQLGEDAPLIGAAMLHVDPLFKDTNMDFRKKAYEKV